MLSFSEFREKETSELVERMLNVGGKGGFPKYNQVIFLAGGAGSGKGFVLKNFLGTVGKVFDVDKLKEMASKGKSSILAKKFLDFKENKEKKKITDLNLKTPEDVALLHKFIAEMKIDKHVIDNFFKSQTSNAEKDNVIFDVTLKNSQKLEDYSKKAIDAGYSKENIHIVWIINDIDKAIEQNKTRDRQVPENILRGTHVGVASSMEKLLKDFTQHRMYADGYIYLFFNNAGIDNEGIKHALKNGKEFFEVGKYSAVVIKEKGKAVKTNLIPSIVDKINKYIPKEASWSK